VSISGGKDSTALAIHLKQSCPELPLEFIFCDTGCELPETYDYLERLEALLGQKVERLSALDILGVQRKPGRTPFDIYLKELYGGFLPSPRSRWCTRLLKIRPFEAYVGDDHAYSYIGIRADEDRPGYVAQKPPVISQQANIQAVYPLRDQGVGIGDVRRIIEQSGLAMPSYYRWRTRSGCYFCFYQQIAEWQGLLRNHPELFDRAKTYEKTDGSRRYTWVEGRTLGDVAGLPRHELYYDDEAGCAVCHL
jgi:3'-phosphoadenosine 5'-phosphosulfate sulfotransferase (PAPS reductase)/FAD synthetase